jgi:hypothetical protein
LFAVTVGFIAMYALPFPKTLPYYGYCLTAVELLMGIFVIQVSLALTQDKMGAFARSVLRAPLDIPPMLMEIQRRMARKS